MRSISSHHSQIQLIPWLLLIVECKFQAGIVFKDPARAFELPSSGIDTRKLVHSSNIRSPGKWLFRIDLPQLVSCPAGRTNPPFCDSGNIPSKHSTHWVTPHCLAAINHPQFAPIAHLDMTAINPAIVPTMLNAIPQLGNVQMASVRKVSRVITATQVSKLKSLALLSNAMQCLCVMN